MKFGVYGMNYMIGMKLMIKIVWKHKPFGSTPVQATGWINNRPFYFRSRYKTSEIEIANQEDINKDPKSIIDDDNTIHVLKEYKTPYEAGYIEYHEAERLITSFAESLVSTCQIIH